MINHIASAPYDMFINARQKAIPLFGTFELTPRCNFNCKMCYVHLSSDEISLHGKELDAEEWISLGKQAMQAGTLFLCITGGEPTTHPDFYKIYSELSKMGFIITLQSNLYSFNDKCIKLFEQAPPQSIKFTIYGASDTTYKKVCGISDGFSKVFENIKLLQKLKIPLEAVTTVTVDNVNDLPEISSLMKELHIPWISSSGLRKSVRGANPPIDSLRLPDSAYQSLCEDVTRLIEKEKIKTVNKPCEKCKEYRMGYWIKWNGDMSFCSFLNEPKIKASTLGINEAWKQLVDYEEKLQWPKECLECKWSKICPRCAATFATESGNINKVNKDFCHYIDRIFNNTTGG